ncbi:uncharacterized protein RAG0_15707 [Rhynchosporium agropyri]|uniref:N-acetyltransferase domain-containing protein n=1 Tax=Rhynchosporium agropyri TaxID=914238 RepID=A0A1E1LMC5_9HELO|nr:uncharacterized protein RAG0_15707 [Rhynchosporium agropyri]
MPPTTIPTPHGPLSIYFGEAKDEQILSCHGLAGVAFGQPLSSADYIKREDFMMRLASKQGEQRWWRIWCAFLGEYPGQVLASCKTTRRDMLMKEPSTGKVYDHLEHCISSVVVESAHRGLGIGAYLLAGIKYWLDTEGEVALSMLYSSKEDFYLRYGWTPVYTPELFLHIQKSFSETNWGHLKLPPISILHAKDVRPLCERDITALRSEISHVRIKEGEIVMTLLPTAELIGWLHGRAEFFGLNLFDKIPFNKEAICEEDSWVFWHHDFRKRCLYIQRMRSDEQERELKIRCLAALRWGLNSVDGEEERDYFYSSWHRPWNRTFGFAPERAFCMELIADTMRDISLYISRRIEDLPIDGEEEQIELANKIKAKCNACFLWVRLIMDELEGEEREIPVAKTILSWTVLAAQPLTVLELSVAIEQDLKIKLSSHQGAIEGLCGQLVSIDASKDLVQIVHATAREFLLSDEAGEFKVSNTKGNEDMALACIKILSKSAAMIPPRRHLLENKRSLPPSSALLEYATVYFSDHVFAASTSDNQILQELCLFLKKSALKWIETIVATHGLHILIKAAKNLKGYLDRRAKHESPINPLARAVDGWVTDLSRVSSKFGRALTSLPQSTFFLIPPLCPTHSTI